MRLEELGKLRNPMTSSGIEPAPWEHVGKVKYMSIVLQIEGNGRCTILAATWRNWGKPRKTSAKTTFVPVEIPTDNVVNRSLKPYHYGNPLGLHIINQCGRWTLVVSFTPRPLYPGNKSKKSIG
jgi:hypothetical protein